MFQVRHRRVTFYILLIIDIKFQLTNNNDFPRYWTSQQEDS